MAEFRSIREFFLLLFPCLPVTMEPTIVFITIGDLTAAFQKKQRARFLYSVSLNSEEGEEALDDARENF